MAKGYTGEEIVLSNTISIPFTLKNIARISNEYAYQVLYESAILEGRTDKETALNIWHFLRENVVYKEDSKNGKLEILRRPARTLFDGVGDCDCATILTSAILKNLNMPHYYKIVGYENVGDYGHIYPVLIDRQTKKHIAIDFVPEVPKPIYELQYIDAETYNPYNGLMEDYKTIELGCANPNIKYAELPPPPRLEPIGMCQKDLTLEVLKYIDSVTASVPTNAPSYEQAQAENELVKEILKDPDGIDISLKNVEGYDTDFMPVYEILKKSMESANTESVNGLNGFPIGETLQLVGTIAGQYMAGQAIDKQNAQDEYNLGLKLQDTQTQIQGQKEILAQQAAEAERQRQFELEKIRLMQQPNQQMMAVQKNTSIAKTDAPPDEKKEWYKQDWAKYTGIGLLVLIILFMIYYFTTKKSKPLNGARKKKSIRKSMLAGAKRKTHKRRRTRSTTKTPNYKIRKPKVRPMNGKRKTTTKKNTQRKSTRKKNKK